MSRVADDQTAMDITPFTRLTDKALRDIRRVYCEVIPSRASLRALFAIDAAQTDPAEAWMGFFVETVCAQLIWDERPSGVLSDDAGRWALDQFDAAPSLTILAMLVRLVQEAHRLPIGFETSVRARASMFSAYGERPVARLAANGVPYLRLVA